MSVINKMLQELDKRHATADPKSPAAAASGNLAQHVQPVKSAALGSNIFWRVMAAIMAVVVGWVIWVAWQIMPRAVVTDRAYQSLAQSRPPAPPPPLPSAAIAAAPDQAAPAPPAVPPVPQPVAAVVPPSSLPAAAAPAAAASPPAASADTVKIDMLRFATEIAVPIRSRAAKSVPVAARARSIDRETIAALKADAGVTKERPPAGRAEPAPRARAAAAAPDPGRIDKRVDVTPGERAESEFRRAMGLVNQGRMAEGMDGLQATLAADPAYELARQTLVALLLESQRTDAAAVLLQEGLAINPAHVGYGMLLARIYVERGDPGGALSLLRSFENVARNNAEYFAFIAALLQRLGRHGEAIDQYRSALGFGGGVGAWWVGLGISQEALERKKDAAESFQRAKGTGTLGAELLAYVERRLKQLQ